MGTPKAWTVVGEMAMQAIPVFETASFEANQTGRAEMVYNLTP